MQYLIKLFLTRVCGLFVFAHNTKFNFITKRARFLKHLVLETLRGIFVLSGYPRRNHLNKHRVKDKGCCNLLELYICYFFTFSYIPENVIIVLRLVWNLSVDILSWGLQKKWSLFWFVLMSSLFMARYNWNHGVYMTF